MSALYVRALAAVLAVGGIAAAGCGGGRTRTFTGENRISCRSHGIFRRVRPGG
jgi:hypothetical protein